MTYPTRAQVNAARGLVRRWRATGAPVRAAVLRIAEAVMPSTSCTCLGEVTAEGYTVLVEDPGCVYHTADE